MASFVALKLGWDPYEVVIRAGTSEVIKLYQAANDDTTGNLGSSQSQVLYISRHVPVQCLQLGLMWTPPTRG
jgi:hypothetical protein